jgi:hypothetical protein
MIWFGGDDWPTAELLALRRAWATHYVAKGCSRDKAFWLAHKKTHTWPPR